MHFIFTFLILFGFWLVWSGFFDAFHVTLGLISSLIVTLWSRDLFFQSSKQQSFGTWVKQWLQLEIYIIWLFWQIILSNIHVVMVALHPNPESKMTPKMFSFKTKLKDDFAKFILAQSITLTPGTVTVDIEKDTFHIHALTKATADGCPGDMESKLLRIFGGSK